MQSAGAILLTFANPYVWRNAITQTNPPAAKLHVALRVRDLGRSVDFYRKLFAAEPVKLRRGYAKFDIAQPPLNFTLNESSPTKPPVPGALSHLGIQVASTGEVLEMRDRWSRAGLDTRDEMKTECCYALQDKAWVRDPDGNEWEAFAVLEDNLPPEKVPEDTPHSAACCAPPNKKDCCAPAK
jgi:catechol 2,3-dioxygenase-like lactoylglutathione lyase family enzyme